MKTVDFEKRIAALERRAEKLGYATSVPGTSLARCLVDRSMARHLNIEVPPGKESVVCWSLGVGGLMQVKMVIAYDLTIDGCLRRAEKHLDEAEDLSGARRRPRKKKR